MKINKNGFTLVEIAIVVAIIGLLAIIVMPKIADIFGDSVTKAMKVQENEIRDAALLYLEDYCKNPIGDNKCRLAKNSNMTFSGEVSLSTLVNNDYIEPVTLQGTTCNGCVIFANNVPTVYLSCGTVGDEAYKTTGYTCN